MTVHGIVVSVTSAKGQNDVNILKVSGYLDTTTAGELEAALYGLLEKANFKIVVDLSGVTYISSAGWGIFIGEIKKIRNNGGGRTRSQSRIEFSRLTRSARLRAGTRLPVVTN